eukprot:9503727-Pyramimonas_sp.AAC.1
MLKLGAREEGGGGGGGFVSSYWVPRHGPPECDRLRPALPMLVGAALCAEHGVCATRTSHLVAPAFQDGAPT